MMIKLYIKLRKHMHKNTVSDETVFLFAINLYYPNNISLTSITQNPTKRA